MSVPVFLYTLVIRPVTLFFEAGRTLIFRLSGSAGISLAAMILIECLLVLPLIRRLTGPGFQPAALNAKQRKTDRNNRILLVLCCLYMAILTGLLIPSTLIGASPAEFVDAHYYRDPVQYLISSVALATGTFVVWTIGYGFLLSPKQRKYFTLLTVIFAAVSAMDYMLFGKDYGFISSALQYETAITNHIEKVILNTACVIVTAGAVYLVWKKHPVILRIVSLYGCIALTVMSVLNITSIERKAGRFKILRTALKRRALPSAWTEKGKTWS